MPSRDPVHVVYGGAHLFKRDTIARLGALARRSFEEYAPDAETLARVFEIPDALARIVHSRVAEKLRREPVEDFHIDFEDGFGIRADAEEDAAAIRAAEESAQAMRASALPAFFGIRIKPLDRDWKLRGLRTLDLFLRSLLETAGGPLPENFVVTLPKVTAAGQIEMLLDALDRYAPIPIELMVETPATLRLLPRLIEAARGRCAAAHFGAYDYTAALGIANQRMRHPACDFARSAMQLHLAGTGIRISDGATNAMPIPPHRGAALSEAQMTENRAAVHRAWKIHFDHVRYSLDGGFYQSWDLHPAQLPARFAAVYSFFLEGLDAASARWKNFLARSAQATATAGVFDDAATGHGLRHYFLRAIDCGAIAESEAAAITGVTLGELRSESLFAAFVR